MIRFTKLHGLGNDYLYVDGFSQKIADPGIVAAKISDRHFGVGSDGLIIALPSDKADLRMRMFNADGLEGEMCGNGIRCLAKFAYERGLAKTNPMRIETGRGVLSLDLKVEAGKVFAATVNVSEPILRLADIPVNRDLVGAGHTPHEYTFIVTRKPMVEEVIAYSSDEPRTEAVLRAVFVSTGNPHAVIFVDDVKGVNLEKLGPLVEHHPVFPRRVNAHWVQVHSPREVTMRTWERGSGITLACGTGACAVCTAGVLTGRTERKLLVHLPGGDLNIEWRESDNNLYLTGPATEVFSGEWAG
jgi:diaminopimelate epimerase